MARSQRCFLLLQGKHETEDRARVAFLGVSETLLSFAITIITITENFGDRAVEGKRRQGHHRRWCLGLPEELFSKLTTGKERKQKPGLVCAHGYVINAYLFYFGCVLLCILLSRGAQRLFLSIEVFC